MQMFSKCIKQIEESSFWFFCMVARIWELCPVKDFGITAICKLRSSSIIDDWNINSHFKEHFSELCCVFSLSTYLLAIPFHYKSWDYIPMSVQTWNAIRESRCTIWPSVTVKPLGLLKCYYKAMNQTTSCILIVALSRDWEVITTAAAVILKGLVWVQLKLQPAHCGVFRMLPSDLHGEKRFIFFLAIRFGFIIKWKSFFLKVSLS